MLLAWAQTRGFNLAKGTLNLCADRPVNPTSTPIYLAEHKHLAQPLERQNQAGFDPRLYPVMLDDQHAWLYRWSDEKNLKTFVGNTDRCNAVRHCEIVAEMNLREALDVDDGDNV